MTEPVGIKEIAERLGVRRTTVDQWLQRKLLPDSTWTVGGRPAWEWSEIEAWAKATGRTIVEG
jgi:predicted DNA-binding transcriptional regulator AlpA